MKMKNEPRVVCIGNFDGVHRGHQALLLAAQQVSPHVIVLTFEPHPRQIFSPDTKPFRITTPEQKNDLLRRYGAREIITMPFSRDFASMSAEEFISNIIRKQAKADYVVVGEDFHFGKDRAGHVSMLQTHADKGEFGLTVLALAGDGDKWSSTNIRGALHIGDIALANHMLGWRYNLSALVVEGDKRGRELGFPTANQYPGDRQLPSYGVYASWVHHQGKRYKGATNIGIRPMFHSAVPLVETHLLDFDGDLYGQNLTVEPVVKLRDEARYDTLDALVTQIAADCAQARELLGSPGHE